jgi:hypothetical protein
VYDALRRSLLSRDIGALDPAPNGSLGAAKEPDPTRIAAPEQASPNGSAGALSSSGSHA